MHGSQLMAGAAIIVRHMVDNWEEFSIMPHDSEGVNYTSSDEYFADVSLPFTYGGLRELMAAGQLFVFVFEVYRNGDYL